jgi:predicted lipoprotein with Yx(FWY)xxD motif
MKLAGPTIIGSVAVTAALLIAGCGSGGGSSNTTAAAQAATNSSGGAVVSSAKNSSLGTVLVDGQGKTLYMFAKDTGSTSTCDGACATNWPPLTTTGDPQVSGGLSASAVKTTKRSDGSLQVTFDGHPLYYFAGDKASGDAAGQGLNEFGAMWYVLDSSGKQVTAAAPSGSSSSSSSSSSSGGGGYAY